MPSSPHHRHNYDNKYWGHPSSAAVVSYRECFISSCNAAATSVNSSWKMPEVCVCVCVCVCARLSLYVCVRLSLSLSLSLPVCVCACVCVSISLSLSVCVRACTREGWGSRAGDCMLLSCVFAPCRGNEKLNTRSARVRVTDIAYTNTPVAYTNAPGGPPQSWSNQSHPELGPTAIGVNGDREHRHQT